MALVKFTSRPPSLSVHFVKAPESTLIHETAALPVKARAALRIGGPRNNVLSATARAIKRVKTFRVVLAEVKVLLKKQVFWKNLYKEVLQND
jgi:hypothetical protein